MEMLKSKISIITGIAAFVLLCGIAYYLLVVESSFYYTKIDNSKVEPLSTGTDMKYQYTLACYQENGMEKEIKFKTKKKLKEGALIKMKVMITRGVISWQEISYQELPSKVIGYYQE